MNRGLGILFVLAVGCSSRVTGGLDEERANEAVAWLETRGIAASKSAESGGSEARFAIEVPSADVGEALALLDDADLPRREDPGIAETYAEASLVPSPTEERARYLAAVSGELARTLERIDGVVDARVHVAVPDAESRAIDAPVPPARASALLTLRRGAHIDTHEVERLIAGAVDGLSREDVSVVVAPRRRLVEERARYARPGPFRVSPSSSRPLATILGVSIALHVALAVAILALVRRRIPERFSTPVGEP